MLNTWQFSSLDSDHKREGKLLAYWEVAFDPISDDYTPDDISADDLLAKWAAKAKANYQNQLVPISWHVRGAATETMPFQFGLYESPNFLTHYSWPVNVQSGDPLNWVMLPVMDKHWNSQKADKGGFIQEATGWKPAILQPFVHLPTLLATR